MIIVGGNGRAAIQWIVDNQHQMKGDQKAKAKELIEKFVDDVEDLKKEVADNS